MMHGCDRKSYSAELGGIYYALLHAHDVGTGAGDLLHGRLERRPTKSDFLYIMTHFEENLSSLRSQGITLSYYGTVLQARASERDTWLALSGYCATWHGSTYERSKRRSEVKHE